MDTEIIEAVMADLNLDRAIPLPTHIGERHVAEHDIYPRIVWVPTSDSFCAPEVTSQTPRQLSTDIAGYAIHVWDKTIDSTRLLMHQVLAALHRQLSAFSYDVDGANWITAGELAACGHLVVLNVSLKIPVIDRVVPTARADSAELTVIGKPQFISVVEK